MRSARDAAKRCRLSEGYGHRAMSAWSLMTLSGYRPKLKSRSATLLPLWWKPVRLMSYAASLAEATVRWASMLAVFSKALSPQSFRSCAQLLSTSKDIYGYFP